LPQGSCAPVLVRYQVLKNREGKIMRGPRPELADFHRKVLMDDMMPVVGVDLLDAIDVDGGRGYIRARASCHGCTGKTFCRDWLVEHREGVPQSFCPNAEFFRTVTSSD
jgi:hypothetical protein